MTTGDSLVAQLGDVSRNGAHHLGYHIPSFYNGMLAEIKFEVVLPLRFSVSQTRSILMERYNSPQRYFGGAA